MSLRKLVIAGATAAVALGATATQASATHEIGHAIVGGAIGAIIGNAIVNSQPKYVQPAPVYVQPAPVYVQPRCEWRRVRVSDGYGGWYWGQQQYCY